MISNNKSILNYYITLAVNGSANDIDIIMKDINREMTIENSKFIDFALGHVETDEGIDRISHYLFNGTQIQRNYCTLYFNRRNDWDIVSKAYKMGLIDVIQAYSR
ncbi:MAG: hypothetical protein ACOWWH_06950 [Eubacteriaceae bacterium]